MRVNVRRLLRMGCWAGLAAGLGLYAGCGTNPRAQKLEGQDDPRFAAAVRLYQANCATCHGDHLQGGVGPSLQHVGSRMTEAQIARQIEVGGGPMPGYGPDQQGILTRQEIQTLAAWLASLR